jgi:hypothetical protein
MTTDQIIAILDNFVPFAEDDIENNNELFLDALMDDLSAKSDFEKAVNPIFHLIEKYPGADFGHPGPLVHALEAKTGLYEDSLQKSLNRKPTRLTAWMLNRIINAEQNEIIKANFTSRLVALKCHPLIDSTTKELVQGFIDHQDWNRQA